MKKKVTIVFILLALLGTILFFLKNRKTPEEVLSITTTSPYIYNFNVDGVLEEAGSINESKSRYWWLNSGGLFNIEGGVGKTIQKDLPYLSKWRQAYYFSNPVDTDDGYHPQNIFRLLTKSKWKNLTQSTYFKINKDNLSLSPNRNASNGVLLFSRYLDGNNLYYAGIRVDGAFVIKKKKEGKYYTLAYRKYHPESNYDRILNPSLMPKARWVGIKTEVVNQTISTIGIKLYFDNGIYGRWFQVLEAKDDGISYGGPAITGEGFAGIRTDFMDVEFDNYKISNL